MGTGSDPVTDPVTATVTVTATAMVTVIGTVTVRGALTVPVPRSSLGRPWMVSFRSFLGWG